jgi:hypothetical protein
MRESLKICIALVCFVMAVLGFVYDHFLFAFVALCLSAFWTLDTIEDWT